MAVFDLELTISGLCVIVMKSEEGGKPRRPIEVDVLAPGVSQPAEGDHAHHGNGKAMVHKPRLSFWPLGAQWDDEVPVYLQVHPRGHKQAVLDLADHVVAIECGLADRVCRVEWTDERTPTPRGKSSERYFDWVPSVQDIGIAEIHTPDDASLLPPGASARLILPAGELYARRMVRDERGEPLVWGFDATGDQKVIANEVVFRTTAIEGVRLSLLDKQGNSRGDVDLETDPGDTLYLDFSNDVEKLPSDYNVNPQETLEHVQYLASMATGSPRIRPPRASGRPHLTGRARTAWPICHQTFYVRHV